MDSRVPRIHQQPAKSVKIVLAKTSALLPRSVAFWSTLFILVCAASLLAQFLVNYDWFIGQQGAQHQELDGVQSSGLDTIEDGSFLWPLSALSTGGFVESDELLVCPLVPPSLVGRVNVSLTNCQSFDELSRKNAWLAAGGHGKPQTCTARHRVAIIVPYRNREDQLRCFLQHMHAFLNKQQLDYAIYVVEQVQNQTFNRAKLMNVGVMEALKDYDWQCFVFHDVDLFPEDDRILYTCPEAPRHMSVAMDKFNYRLPYWNYFGGVSALTVEQFTKMNGFSNDYWGWGGEDDDMSNRVGFAGYNITRYPVEIARYKMVKHEREESNSVNKCRFNLMQQTEERWQTDGFKSLTYKLLSKQSNRLFTLFIADLLEEESRPKTAKFGCE